MQQQFELYYPNVINVKSTYFVSVRDNKHEMAMTSEKMFALSLHIWLIELKSVNYPRVYTWHWKSPLTPYKLLKNYYISLFNLNHSVAVVFWWSPIIRLQVASRLFRDPITATKSRLLCYYVTRSKWKSLSLY